MKDNTQPQACTCVENKIPNAPATRVDRGEKSFGEGSKSAHSPTTTASTIVLVAVGLSSFTLVGWMLAPLVVFLTPPVLYFINDQGLGRICRSFLLLQLLGKRLPLLFLSFPFARLLATSIGSRIPIAIVIVLTHDFLEYFVLILDLSLKSSNRVLKVVICSVICQNAVIFGLCICEQSFPRIVTEVTVTNLVLLEADVVN